MLKHVIKYGRWHFETLPKTRGHSGCRCLRRHEIRPGRCWIACHVRCQRWVQNRIHSRSRTGSSGRCDVAMGPLHQVPTNGTRRNHCTVCIERSCPMPFPCSHRKCGLQHFWQWPQWGLCHHISGESWLGQNHHGWHGRANCQCSVWKGMTHAESNSWVFGGLHCLEFDCQTWCDHHLHPGTLRFDWMNHLCFLMPLWNIRVHRVPRSLPDTPEAKSSREGLEL